MPNASSAAPAWIPACAGPHDLEWLNQSSQESENLLLNNARSVCMESTCPICGQMLEAHADPQMAECGLVLMERDYGHSYTEGFVWMCPGCDGKIDDGRPIQPCRDAHGHSLGWRERREWWNQSTTWPPPRGRSPTGNRSKTR